MKLQLKDLAPYLPYGLKMYVELYDDSYEIQEVASLSADTNEWWNVESGDNFFIDEPNCKPILRPLSDLLKDEFTEIYDSLNYTDKTNLLLKSENRHEAVNSFRYYEFVKLLENHFDVFNLIPQNLAIDINTLYN